MKEMEGREGGGQKARIAGNQKGTRRNKGRKL